MAAVQIVPAATPARSATGTICTAAMPPAAAASRAASTMASWRALSLRTTFSVRR